MRNNNEYIAMWRKNNREKAKIQSYKSSGKTFMRHYAKLDDVIDFINVYVLENENFNEEDFLINIQELIKTIEND